MKTRIAQILTPLWTDLHPHESGWASRALAASIRRTVLAGVAGWQLVMAMSTLLSEGGSGGLLISAEVVLALIALLLMAPERTRHLWIVPAAMASLGVAGCFVAGDIGAVLAFTSFWQITFATFAAGLLLFSRWVVPAVLVGAVTISMLLLEYLPDWGTQLAGSIPLTQTSIIVSLRLGLPMLLRLAVRADDEEAAAERARDQAEITHRVSAQVAEESRVLHDTAINTLSAIATGGVSIQNTQQVRDECARNLAVLRGLRGEQAASNDPGFAFQELLGYPGLPIRRVGLDDGAVRELIRELPSGSVVGMIRAIREAIVNANKHASATHIEISIAREGRDLRIEVRDDGVGFDPTTVTARGLTHSISTRADTFGFTASLNSSPGAGTAITLTASPDVPDRTDSLIPTEESVDRVVAGLHRQAGLLWGGGVTLVTVLIILLRTSHYQSLYPMSYALYPMIAVMASAWIAVKAARLGASQWWGKLGLILAALIVFLFSAAATSFGTAGAVHWHVLAATGPAVLLLSTRPSLRWLCVAGGLWGLTVGVVAALTWRSSETGAVIVVIAGASAGAFSYVWLRFMRRITALSIDAAAAQQRTVRAQRAAAADRAAQDTYRRWVDAGLDSAAELLHAISNGTRSPNDPDTQTACGREEAYLRQLILVSPELVHIGHTAMCALRNAHENGITLSLRLGGQDAPDEDTAHSLSKTLTDAIRSASPGQKLTASVFPVQNGLQLTLVESPEGMPEASGDIRQFTYPITRDDSAVTAPTTAPILEGIRNP